MTFFCSNVSFFSLIQKYSLNILSFQKQLPKKGVLRNFANSQENKKFLTTPFLQNSFGRLLLSFAALATL